MIQTRITVKIIYTCNHIYNTRIFEKHSKELRFSDKKFGDILYYYENSIIYLHVFCFYFYFIKKNWSDSEKRILIEDLQENNIQKKYNHAVGLFEQLTVSCFYILHLPTL